MSEGTDITPEGFIWMCGVCGKLSLSCYGFDSQNKNCAEGWYDESCMLNAYLMEEKDLPSIISDRCRSLRERYKK